MEIDYRVYLVTDEPSRYRGVWLDNVRAAVEGGVTCVQYRDTESEFSRQYERVLALRDAIGGVPIIVNNDAELAKAVKAQGVHVGQRDMSPKAVRGIVGEDCEIGLSITELSQVAAIDRGVVDVVGIGPVFDARKTKADAAEAMGLMGLREIVSATHGIRNCAIGGITLENAEEIIAQGAQGLVLVSEFSQAEDAYGVAKKLRMLFDNRGQ